MTTVLIADDTTFMRAVLRSIVEKEGYEVMEATNGKEAVEMYNEHGPDVVTMDIIMPEMDGISAARVILEKDPKARIIMVTAVDNKEALKEAIKTGVSDFIVKPFKAEEVLESIKKSLKRE